MAQPTPFARITRRGVAVRTFRFASGGALDSQFIFFVARARVIDVCA
jgi:hypothetical protein